jgi:hypothetical protein
MGGASNRSRQQGRVDRGAEPSGYASGSVYALVLLHLFRDRGEDLDEERIILIKYHELRNDRVLVLCPKRLRDNWTLYKANDRRNFLAPDRFNYDVYLA